MKTSTLILSLIASSIGLFAAQETPNVEVQVRSQSVEVRSSVATFVGEAVVTHGDTRVFADKVVFDRDSGRMECSGNVRIEGPNGAIITVSDVLIDTKGHTLTMRNASVSFRK